MGNISGAVAVILVEKRKAENGVIYMPRSGACCPSCGSKLKIVTTRSWEDGIRVRYHRCSNQECVLSSLSAQIKSIEKEDKRQ